MPMMRGASAPKEDSKESLLATKYRLDGSLPYDLKKWSHEKMNRATGGIPYGARSGDYDDDLSQDTFANNREAISEVFQDRKVNLQQREVIARSVLEGTYQQSSNGNGVPQRNGQSAERYDRETGRLVKEVYDTDIMRSTAQVNRARMRPLNFLEAQGEQMDIVLVDARTVMEFEQTKNVARVKSPNKGKRALYSFAGRTLKEETIPISVEIRREEEDRMRNSFMSTSKKAMYLDAKNRELGRTKAYLKWQKEAARRAKLKDKDRKHEMQLRREAVRKFRTDLRRHLESSDNPMMGTIMRYVDDGVAWNIMNAYRGHAMSMDMVVSLIGQTLGTLEGEDGGKNSVGSGPSHSQGGDLSSVGSGVITTPRGVTITPSSASSAGAMKYGKKQQQGSNSKHVHANPLGASFITEVEVKDGDVRNLVEVPPVDIPKPAGYLQEEFDDSVISETCKAVPEMAVKGLVDTNNFLKPYSAGHKSKYVAKQNLFAPSGLKKKGPEALPFTDELVKYQLGSRPGTGASAIGTGTGRISTTGSARASTAGSPNRPGSSSNDNGNKRNGNSKNEFAPHEMKQHWNSETVADQRHPNDRIQIEKQTGEIINQHAWHSMSNPGGRVNTPGNGVGGGGALLKGWNAGDITMKKTAAGFVAKKMESVNSNEERHLVDEIFALDDAMRDSRLAALGAVSAADLPEDTHLAFMQSFLDGSQVVTDSGANASVSASITDSIPPGANENDYPTRGGAGEISVDINNDIAWPLAEAIEHEKIALGTIPRYQPEKVLSDEQLKQLGEKQVSIDTIAAQLRWAKQKRERQLEERTALIAAAAEQARLNSEEGGATTGRVGTSQSLADLNAMASDTDPRGGISIRTSEFANMDVEMGFRPMPLPGSHEDIGIKPVTPKHEALPSILTDTGGTLANNGTGGDTTPQQQPVLQHNKSLASSKSHGGDGSLFSLENPKEIQRLLDSNITAPPKQLKSTLTKSLPESPFKSYESRMKIIQSGIASNAGMGLWLSEAERAARLARWGPRAKSREGRYRVGQSSYDLTESPSPTKEEKDKRKKTFGQLLS